MSLLDAVIAAKLSGGGGGGEVTPASIVTATGQMTAQQKAETRANIGATDASTSIPDNVKQALLACFADVAWVDDQGQTHYDALEAALYPLDHITAVYTQSGTVYDTDSLDGLKTDLVVTAVYEGGNTETVPAANYTLSGTLTEGTSTITVSYGGKATTFDVVVTSSSMPSGYVTDGLVFFLDGRLNIDVVNGTWTDLIGGKMFALTDCTASNGGVVFNGTSSKGEYDGTLSSDWETETIEAAIDTTMSASRDILNQPGSGISLRLGLSGEKMRVVLNAGAFAAYCNFPSSENAKLISGIKGKAVINKSAHISSEPVSPTAAVATTIGVRKTSNGYGTYYPGTIYAIRIYNRKLTAAEMLQNQQADIDRYGITI